LLSKDKNIKDRVVACSINTATKLCDLLEAKKNSEKQTEVEIASTGVTTALNELIEAIKSLPDAKGISVDQNLIELENEVEAELQRCNTFIKDSLKSLGVESKKPIKGEPDQVKAIVSCVNAITTATKKLVEMAITTNKKRREKKGPQSQLDPTNANGIIESSKSVIVAIGHLIESAKSSINGKIDEESLVNFSRAVTSATAQLVAASLSKSDKETQKLLNNAQKAIAEATSQLQFALQSSNNLDSNIDTFSFEDDSRTQELQAQMKILRLQKEYERDKRRMERINQ